ncbi:hypothetical protein BDZ94DRAFT_1313087 [Collybia nuda]|uniref:Mitochondrial carrier protein n=1 Tax=Collybia nuda TaxID=64659 RepID=A0A9P5XVU6_9AGAR|nr:hypothetical protein BDZ94DRAFT_1313087 [Collybia nuda]
MSGDNPDGLTPQGNIGEQANFEAAVARTLARSLALYFSRPVRLFRPTKVSGWQSIKALAAQHGKTLDPQYIISLVKNQGVIVIPKHFVPPMLVNALLGTVLWTTYTETSKAIESTFEHHPTLTTALAGGVAGGMQALVAAPAENVRIIMEGGSTRIGNPASNAWKEVFRGTSHVSNSKQTDIHDIRQVRRWMKDVGEMAGRGWGGWGWGFGKDICGFAFFFSIFEVTRRVALRAKTTSFVLLNGGGGENIAGERSSFGCVFPRVIHCGALITGGVVAGLAYEIAARPWDVARRTVHLEAMKTTNSTCAWTIVMHKLQRDGIRSFFELHFLAHDRNTSTTRRKLHGVFRTLGRVGPWGIGFLVWEIYGGV